MQAPDHPHGSAPATLTPGQLAQSAINAVREIVSEATSPNTARSYSSALRYWAAWHQGRYGEPISLPVPPATVTQFVVDHLERARQSGASTAWELPETLDRQLVAAGMKKRPGPLKLATVVHRVSVLSAAHQMHRLPNPCETPEIRKLLAKGRRAAHRRGERPAKKTAVTATELEAMAATCTGGTLKDIRDRAILYFAFASGGRRRSEVADADMRDLRRVEGGFVYRLLHGKTLQDGPRPSSTPDKPILGVAAEALDAWLKAAGITEGKIFRRVWRGERVGESLGSKAVAEIIVHRARLAGLEGDFGGHSLRSGFVTECGRQGIALPAVMAMTDHRSVSSVIGYFQAGGATENPAARILEKERKTACDTGDC